jgi:hypothetical protein
VVVPLWSGGSGKGGGADTFVGLGPIGRLTLDICLAVKVLEVEAEEVEPEGKELE